jgi:replicative DNA helicase
VSDVAGIVLNSILKNPDEMLDVWPKLKLQYFNSNYSEIFAAITKYYNKFNALPNFQSLEMTVRDSNINKKIKALSLLEVNEDIDIHIAVEALIDQYTQEEILNNLSKYVDKITHYDSSESILKLSEIVMHMEDVVDHSEEDFLMSDLPLMEEEELKTKIPFTLNNTLDANTGGIELTNLVMIGGHRGSGKTIAGCNIACNHYNNGGVTMFFTIEMRAREINWRVMSILSGVSNKNIKNHTCTPEELDAIAKTRAEFFLDSENVYNEYLIHRNYLTFEKDLVSSKVLKPDNQIIIIDNPTLTLSEIDAKIQKYKTKHGDKLQAVVVDSINKLVNIDKYDWKHQIENADKLKDFAAKHNVLMISSYQTDTSGEARFAKGILDSGDYAMNLTNNGEYMTFESQKTRGTPAFKFNAPVDWSTLKISQQDAVINEEGDTKDKSEETARDLNKEGSSPWT